MKRSVLAALLPLVLIACSASGGAEVDTQAEAQAGGHPPIPVCPVGDAICHGACADLRHDALHCGSCATACPAGDVCRNGTCGGCATSADCAAAQYCKHPDGQCSAFGACAPAPNPNALCGGPFTPVCGCDGVTYPGPCFVVKAEASIAHVGACP